MSYTNGDKYEGNWANNSRQGQGTLTCTNGDVQKGEW